MEPVSPGLWRGRILGRPLWLVSNRDVPIDRESASVRMVSDQTVEQTRELANVVVESDELWQAYVPVLDSLFPELSKEFDAMAAKHGRGEIDWDLVLERIAKRADPKKVAKTVLNQISVDDLLAILTPEQRRELVKRLAAGKK